MNLAECFAHWGEVHALTLETFGLFRDDELAYVAYRGGWSVQEIMLHIANTEDGWLRYVVTRELPGWPTAHTPKRYPTVASNQALLAEVHAAHGGVPRSATGRGVRSARRDAMGRRDDCWLGGLARVGA